MFRACLRINGRSVRGRSPDGLSLSIINGGVAISGVPAGSGPYRFVLSVTDSRDPSVGGATGTFAFSGTIVGSTQPALTQVSCSFPSQTDAAGSPITPIVCAASGGTEPYSWSFQGSAPPQGIALSTPLGDVATISGVPAANSPSNSSFYVKVIDSSSPPQIRLANVALSLNGPLLVSCFGVDPNSLTGQVGLLFEPSCGISGGSGGHTVTITGGELPPGVHVDLRSGAIAGFPTTPGVYQFTITATDSSVPTPATASQAFIITIRPLPAPLDLAKTAGSLASRDRRRVGHHGDPDQSVCQRFGAGCSYLHLR